MYFRIEKYIKESKKNKSEIAKEVGVSVSTFYEKLSGKSEISIELATKIKRAVGATEPLEILFEKTVDAA